MTQQGLAFDTNLLSRPLTRRLMLLWMELSGLTVAVLPTVKTELAFRRERATKEQRLLDDLYESVWEESWRKTGSPYELLTLTEDQEELAGEMLSSFTLRCFPKAASKERIARLPDANILAEAIAAGVDMVVTNNMASIDHMEVNALARAMTGSNENIVASADDALLTTHVGGEGSRHLLTMFMASSWPDRGRRSMSMSDCHAHLATCTRGLATGAAMPNCAVRMTNAFDVDEALEEVISNAQTLAQDSLALHSDNEHAEAIRLGLVRIENERRGFTGTSRAVRVDRGG